MSLAELVLVLVNRIVELEKGKQFENEDEHDTQQN